jgi:hypothetical protein
LIYDALTFIQIILGSQEGETIYKRFIDIDNCCF